MCASIYMNSPERQVHSRKQFGGCPGLGEGEEEGPDHSRGVGFPLCVLKKFWHKIVVTVVQHCRGAESH